VIDFMECNLPVSCFCKEMYLFILSVNINNRNNYQFWCWWKAVEVVKIANMYGKYVVFVPFMHYTSNCDVIVTSSQMLVGAYGGCYFFSHRYPRWYRKIDIFNLQLAYTHHYTQSKYNVIDFMECNLPELPILVLMEGCGGS
jgi:hypothetical protein